ncbi:unnamed protein product [Orchesella dallaii]|uniref:Gustatory receptor n=1 Tax=Orchesella dallaii TaxID=48710 RepID=A0ABP1R718_9HEXA
MVQKALQKLFQVTLKPCQYLGLTIFSINQQNQLDFSIRSYYTFCVFLRIMVIVLAIIFYSYARDLLKEMFLSRSSTYDTTENLDALKTLISEGLGMTLIFMNRSKIINFQMLLTEFLGNFPKKYTKAFPILVDNICKQIWRVKIVILTTFFCNSAAISIGIFYVLLNLDLPFTNWPFEYFLMPVVSLSWNANQNLCPLSKLWLISLLHCLKMGAMAIKVRLEYAIENVNEKEVTEILNSFVELESVVASYNEAFGWCNAIDVLSVIIGIVITLFQTIYLLIISNYVGANSCLLPFSLYSIIAFMIFNEGNEFEMKVTI